MPILYIEDEEEDRTGQLQLGMTEAWGRTEQYVPKLVTGEVEKKRKRQQEPPSDVEEGICIICCKLIP